MDKTKRDAILKEYKSIRNKVKHTTVNLLQQEQEKISQECKSNPKKFWEYINRKTHSRVHISDLKWKDDSGKEKTAETDSEKASALQKFFSSVYTVETDHDFELLLSRIIIYQWMN